MGGAALGLLAGFAISASLTVGGNFSPNVRKTPWLPLGTGVCDVANASSPLLNTTMNATSQSNIQLDSEEHYNPFFSLSYCLFSPLGIVLTVTVGILSSFVVGRNRPGDINPKYFLEMSDSIFIWLPPPVRRWLKSKGPQFKSGWEKPTPVANDNDDDTTCQLVSSDNQDQLPSSQPQDMFNSNAILASPLN